MLMPTVAVLSKDHANLLDVIVRTGEHHLPEGTASWGLVAVHRDDTTGERTFSTGQVCPAKAWGAATGALATCR